MRAKRASTRTVYDGRWKAYALWCTERGLCPVEAPVTEVLEYLQMLSETKKLNTVKGYITAISARHCKVRSPGHRRKRRLSKHSALKTWLRGLEQSTHEPVVRVPPWDLELVLSALKRPPYYPLNQASLKHLTWRTVFLVALTSARRASEVHALRADTVQFTRSAVTVFTDDEFLPKVATRWHRNRPIELPVMHRSVDGELRKLCVKDCLEAYLASTRVSRAATEVSQLFLCYGANKLGQAVSKQRISSWLKLLIRDCYVRMGQPPPFGVKGHQVRKQATSWADMALVDPQKICDAALWSSDNMFARHYRLDLHHQGRAELGRRVLQLSASHSAEASVRSRLGPPPASARARGRDQTS